MYSWFWLGSSLYNLDDFCWSIFSISCFLDRTSKQKRIDINEHVILLLTINE